MRLLIIPLLITIAPVGCDSTSSVEQPPSTSEPFPVDTFTEKVRAKAIQGDSGAQYLLGGFYMKGFAPIKRDQTEGMKWWIKSAEHGNPISMLSLAEIYEKGDGVTKDDAEAYVWRWLFVETLDPSNAQPVEESLTPEERKARAFEKDALAKRLAPQALENARARAEKLLVGVQEWRLNQKIVQMKESEKTQIKKLKEDIRQRQHLEEVQSRTTNH